MAIIGSSYTRQCIGSYYGDHAVARIAATASTNATSVKAGPGMVNAIIATNNATSARYLKFYDKASAPVVGTDTPLFTLVLEQSTAPAVISLEMGIPFVNGIAYAIVTGVADSNAVATAADDVHGAIIYS
jgi:hypothetical protein